AEEEPHQRKRLRHEPLSCISEPWWMKGAAQGDGRPRQFIDRARQRRSRSGQTTWTMPVSEVRVVLTALGELGHDVPALLAAATLTETNFDDPDARLTCEAYGALIACACQRRFTPNLALEVARRTPLGAFPLLDYLVITSDTVGAGVRQLARYFRIETTP